LSCKPRQSFPVSRPSVRTDRWIIHWSLRRMACATSDLRLPSQAQSVTAHKSEPNYTASWEKHKGTNNVSRVVTQQRPDREWNRRPLDRKCDVATWRHHLQPRAGTAGQQLTSIHCIVSAHAYVDRSGCIKSSLVGDGVAELEWISSVPVKVAVVNVHRLNDGEAISSWNAVAWWWVATGRTLLLHRLVTQPSSQICTVPLALKEHFRNKTCPVRALYSEKAPPKITTPHRKHTEMIMQSATEKTRH